VTGGSAVGVKLSEDIPGFTSLKDEDLRKRPLVTVLWYALFKGELCRIREGSESGLISEVWRNGQWREGPDFSSVDFTGRAIDRHQADEWIRSRFKDKTFGTPTGVGDRSS
jgi:hypothetical protein